MEEGDYITIYLEINDYPHGARIKVTNKELLEEVARLTSCNISVRGVYVEKGKKAKLAQRKQYIHIQGENKNNVMNAYRELFKVLEEEAEK